MSRIIKRRAEVEVYLSPDEFAEVFWCMDSGEQAGFFNRLGELAQERLPFQIQSIIDSPYLDHNGVYAIRTFSEYGEVVGCDGLVCEDVEHD